MFGHVKVIVTVATSNSVNDQKIMALEPSSIIFHRDYPWWFIRPKYGFRLSMYGTKKWYTCMS